MHQCPTINVTEAKGHNVTRLGSHLANTEGDTETSPAAELASGVFTCAPTVLWVHERPADWPKNNRLNVKEND